MSAREVKKERERQRKHEQQTQREQTSLRKAFNANGNLSENFMNELLTSDDFSTGGVDDLQEVTVAKIQSMLGRDLVLGNLTKAQEHDIRFKLEVMKLKILGIHPHDQSDVTGATRAFLYDDEMEELEPLTQQERLLIDDLIESLKSRITRGREGFERKQMNTNIAETHTRSEQDDSNGGGVIRGLFN